MIGVDSPNGTRRQDEDPFTAQPPERPPHAHRFSSFDTQLFNSNRASSSPGQARRVLQARLSETERRLHETSKLGTTLVEQRKNISERLKDVEKQQTGEEIDPELKKKLNDIEREYSEVSRESIRAFSGSRVDAPSSEDSNNTAALDGRRSPTKFARDATDSPSKLNVPRKQRNQAASRAQDLDFAAEITTSLIDQVKQLQAALAERDDALKAANSEKSRLEHEATGFSMRLKSLDENEQRYKDENWNLETQTHEMMATIKEATVREQKLRQALTLAASEKNSAQHELEEIQQSHGKLTEDFDALRKAHDSELGNLQRSLKTADEERDVMSRKHEDLISQNQELAQGLAGRFRDAQNLLDSETPLADDEPLPDRSDTEHSPPPSPSKLGGRYSALETETLKSSLHHAHRMIQNLKKDMNREKIENRDLKRALQDAKDEMDVRRGGHDGKKQKMKNVEATKRQARLGMLGSSRDGKTDIMMDDEDWEERDSPIRSVENPRKVTAIPGAFEVDQPTETEDGFETANEANTTTDAFETGAESMAGETSDDGNETETGLVHGNTVRVGASRPSLAQRASFESTASTSGDDDDYTSQTTPVHSQPQKYRLRIGRNSRRSRFGSEPLGSSAPSSVQDSPASFMNNGEQGGQSLFNELSGMDDVEGDVDGTPSKRSFSSQRSTPVPDNVHKRSLSNLRRSVTPLTRVPTAVRGDTSSPEPPVPRLPMVDSGMMTEAWEPTPIVKTIEVPVPMQSSATDVRAESARNVEQQDTSALQRDREVSLHESDSGASGPVEHKITPSGTPEFRRDAPHRQQSSASSRRTVWDQPLQMFSNIIPTFGPASQRSDPTPNHDEDVAQASADDSQSKIATPSTTEEIQASKNLGETSTTAGRSNNPASRTLAGESSGSPASQNPPASTLGNSWAHPDGAGGILSSVFGTQTAAQTTTAKGPVDTGGERAPTMSENQPATPITAVGSTVAKAELVDESCQTVLSSEQIEKLMKQRANTFGDKAPTASAAAMRPLADIGAPSPSPPLAGPSQEFSSQERGRASESRDPSVPFFKSPKRPISAGSTRQRFSNQVPPLPADHQQAIAAAAQKVPELAPGAMGPPLAPASSYRGNNVGGVRPPSRSRTPNQRPIASVPASPTSKSGTTPRARYSMTNRSRVSRRSSVSSFESELDARFNIRLEDGMTMPGFESGTDPRMIQAITQTMIGEFLWKYTRKAGRGEMSSNRHKRWFWVHPYTRTLYWSDQDPHTAGRAQLKAKSVAIEAVRVVVDDNPMPPGLHRKSLVVMTPGRSVKFTATTSQRHETWFNALSYLLLRTGADGQTNDGYLTAEDIAEFNPSPNKRWTAGGASLRSWRSNKSNAPPAPSSGAAGASASSRYSTQQPALTSSSTTNATTAGKQPARGVSNSESFSSAKSRGHMSIGSRISEYWKPASRRGSVGSRYSAGATSGTSAEDVRKVYDNRDREGELENVRACCDGIFPPFESLTPIITSERYSC